MRGSSLRSLLTIQRKMAIGSVGDGAYEENGVWTNWREDIPCEIEVRRGREHFDPGTKIRYSEDVWLFRVRYEEAIGLSAKDRILHEDMVFDIKSERPDAQFRRHVIIECTVKDPTIQPDSLSASILQSIPSGVIGAAYPGFMITVTGGTAPYTFADDSPGLAPGLSLDTSTGVVSGTPTAAGEWPCDVVVTDAAGDTVSLFFAISVGSEPETFSFTLTAGQNDDWVGYMPDSFGSISAGPVAGAELISVVMVKPASGEGGIEISGNQYELQSLLSGKDVWIAGTKIENQDGWSFSFNVATWWVTTGFPVFVSGSSYLIEIK